MEPSSPPILSGQPPGKTWYHRNRKWFTPIFCLVVFILLLAIFLLVYTLVRGFHFIYSDAYQTSLATARTNSLLLTAIGAPLKPGLFITGNVKTNGPTGNADLYIPVSGSHGHATIHAVATSSDGTWHFSTMTALANGTTINLQPHEQ